MMYSNSLVSIIFSLPPSNGKLEVFHKYLKPTQETMWEWPGQLGPIPQPGSHQLFCNFTSHHRWNTLLPHLWERPQSSPTPTVRTHAVISQELTLWTPKSGNAPSCTSHSQENIGWQKGSEMYRRQQITWHLTFKLETEFTSKINKLATGTWNGEPDIGLSM